MSTRRVATLLGGSLDRSPAYLGLAEGLRTLISDGRIRVGTRLPSERELTRQLPTSRATVTRAYDVLREQSYVESRQGSGSVARLPVSRAGRTDHLLMPRGSDEDSIDMTIATPPAPPGTTAAYEAAVARLPAYLSGTGYYPTGLPALRQAVAERYTGRGLPTAPEQVVVVGGALAGVAVACQALVRPGDRVLVETPTYPNPLNTFRARGARMVEMVVDPVLGWDLDAAAVTVRRLSPSVAYLVPDFHNPTGAVLEDEGRARLGRVLSDTGVVPIVDESMVDLALDDGQVPRPFAAYCPEAITVGSASKGFWGGLRVGWIRVPADGVSRMTAARLSLDLATPPLEQLVLVEMLAHEPEIRAAHRTALLASRTALLEAVERTLPSWTTKPGRGGLALWYRLPLPLSSALSVTAERFGVYLAAGPSFAVSGGLEHYVRLPYTLPPDLLREAVRRLSAAWDQAPAEQRGGDGRAPVVA